MDLCDFIESTEYGDYCSFYHTACNKDSCVIFKYGLGEDIREAYKELQEITNNMNK